MKTVKNRLCFTPDKIDQSGVKKNGEINNLKHFLVLYIRKNIRVVDDCCVTIIRI